MRALLDTHAFLWWNLDDPQLSQTAQEFIKDRRNQIFLSAVPAWEIAVKAARGRLQLPDKPSYYFAKRIKHYVLSALPIVITHALHEYDLPDIHQDPFDRFLIAQSQTEQLPIVTKDRKIAQYDVDIIW